ncbi:toxin ParE1/3/4 [Trueperella bonasi]|uniref:Toxin n=1 Tax=Trueperella bonasi TaxID=312286 RepID=A0ABT9NED6_9ACTO|nr:type II toxin-antitoxin system RelE/ParE family toxin [Trueperella bonasi]MDP9805751.1 toxin ParE1/3/4 [Trueperella bonasi]
MSQFRLTPAAQRDLSAIWDYTERNWGPNQAEVYLRQIQRTLELVSERNEFGRRRPDINRAYRSIPSGRHVIFYKCSNGAIEVIRILHQRMDPLRHLDS